MRKQQPTHLYLVLCSLDTLSSPCGLFRPPLRLLLLKENAGEMMLIARILPFFSKRWKLVALKSVLHHSYVWTIDKFSCTNTILVGPKGVKKCVKKEHKSCWYCYDL